MNNLSAGTPVFGGIHHASLLVADLATSLEFYQGVLGLSLDTSRPEMDFPGVWLQVAGQQIHLIELPPTTAAETGRHGGRDRHIALSVSGLDLLHRRLEGRSIPFTLSRSGRRALFCRDPDGNALEFVESASGGR